MDGKIPIESRNKNDEKVSFDHNFDPVNNIITQISRREDMRKSKRFWIAAMCILVLIALDLFLIGGCGNGDDSSDPAEPNLWEGKKWFDDADDVYED